VAGLRTNGIPLSGEGRADLICMVPSGQAFAWINDGTSSMRSVSQIKFSQDLDRANFQFADVDGTSHKCFVPKSPFSFDDADDEYCR